MSDERPLYFTRGVPAQESYAPLREVLPEVTQKVITTYGPKLFGYGEPLGFGPLREFLAAEHGVSVDELIVTPGSLQAIELLCQSHLHDGDCILVDEPTYDRALTLFRRMHLQISGVPVLADGPDLQVLRELLERGLPGQFRLYYTQPDFHNPTGLTCSAAKRRELVDLADEHNFLILEDSPYRHLNYWGEMPAQTLREISRRGDQVVRTNSFSKLLWPDLRIGYAIGSPERIRQMGEIAVNKYISASKLGQALAYEFLRNGRYARRCEDLRALYAPRLQACLAALGKFPPFLKHTCASGGFFLTLWLPPGLSAVAVRAEAAKRQLFLADSDPFSLSPDLGARFIRIPFCALQPEEIAEGIARLGEVITGELNKAQARETAGVK